jgi:hypothetical protein
MISFSRFRVAALLAFSTLPAATACVQNQDLVIVERAVWFGERDDCTLGDDSPLAMTVDVLYPTRIGMGFLLTNNQVQYKGSNTGVDDSEITIDTAEVNLSFSGGGISGDTFEVTVPGNSFAGGESEPYLIQIPASVTESLRTTMEGLPPGTIEVLEMEVVFKGRRTNQVGNTKLGSVKTPAYVYPFDICYGCLGSCGSVDDTCAGACPTPTEWTGTCGFAQGLNVIHPTCDAG